MKPAHEIMRQKTLRAKELQALGEDAARTLTKYGT